MTKEELLAAMEQHMKAVGIEIGKEQAGAITGAVLSGLEQYLKSAGFPIPGAEGGSIAQTPGGQFIESEVMKQFTTGQTRSGPVRIDMGEWSLKPGERLEPMQSRWVKAIAAGQAATSLVTRDITGSQFPAQRTYLPFVPFPMRRLRLRDVMPVQGIGTPQIEYARITGYSNNAAKVDEGAAKPQSDISTQNVVDSARVLATFLPVTRQALADVPQLRGWVDQVLEYFVTLVEDNKLLNGPGGSDFTGLLNTPGILTHNRGADTHLDSIRKAITKVNLAFTDAGFEPNAIAINPNDWETLELAKDSNLRYMLLVEGGPPTEGAAPRVWRLNVVPTPAIAAGTSLIGAFDIGCTLWTYEGFTLRVTDSHSDWFTKNLLAILGEQREIFAIYFPKAFVKLLF